VWFFFFSPLGQAEKYLPGGEEERAREREQATAAVGPLMEIGAIPGAVSEAGAPAPPSSP